MSNLLHRLFAFFAEVFILGDIVLATWKANSRNAALLEEFLRVRGEEFLKAPQNRVEDEQVVKPGSGKAGGEPVTH